MNDKNNSSIHWSFWIIGIVALVWNVMGVINFIMQMNPDALTKYSETARAIIENRSVWATIAFAIAVIGGALGSILLLLKKSAAYYLFILSLLGTIVTMLPNFKIDYGLFEITMYLIIPIVVAVFLVWYSRLAKNKGWIN